MKKFIGVAVLMVVVMCIVGCGKKDNMPVETTAYMNTETVAETTETTAEKSTTASKTKPTEKKVVLKDYTRISRRELQHLLISNKWVLNYVIDKRRNFLDSQIAYNTMNTEIIFDNNGTFTCDLGKTGCSGTYTVDSGVITMNVKEEYVSSEKSKVSKKLYAYYRYLVNENQQEEETNPYNEFDMIKEKQEDYQHTIVFDYSAGENYFIPKQ